MLRYITYIHYILKDVPKAVNLARYGRGRCGCAFDWNDVEFAPFPLVVVGIPVDDIVTLRDDKRISSELRRARRGLNVLVQLGIVRARPL